MNFRASVLASLCVAYVYASDQCPQKKEEGDSPMSPPTFSIPSHFSPIPVQQRQQPHDAKYEMADSPRANSVRAGQHQDSLQSQFGAYQGEHRGEVLYDSPIFKENNTGRKERKQSAFEDEPPLGYYQGSQVSIKFSDSSRDQRVQTIAPVFTADRVTRDPRTNFGKKRRSHRNRSSSISWTDSESSSSKSTTYQARGPFSEIAKNIPKDVKAAERQAGVEVTESSKTKKGKYETESSKTSRKVKTNQTSSSKPDRRDRRFTNIYKESRSYTRNVNKAGSSQEKTPRVKKQLSASAKQSKKASTQGTLEKKEHRRQDSRSETTSDVGSSTYNRRAWGSRDKDSKRRRHISGTSSYSTSDTSSNTSGSTSYTSTTSSSSSDRKKRSSHKKRTDKKKGSTKKRSHRKDRK
jgi:hypothetical protein